MEKRERYFLQPGRPCPGGTTVGIWQAVQIARHFAHREPSPQELMQAYGMSRATAYRWVSALKAAA